jgi:glutamate formiminotransferase/formiminotetrahydrofolate cyclodeaminase
MPDIRKGEFEGLRERIGVDPAAEPDFGPARIHPSAGATAIGARPFLVAYNVYLDSGDVGIAKQIAKAIRTSSGGLPAVQANGFDVGGLAQVSMNLLDIDITSPATAFAAVQDAAAVLGVAVRRSEIVGLVPERGILGAGAEALKLPDAADHLLEAKIRAAEGPSLDGWIEALAGASPVPGGGSAAALAGTLAGALVAMVARLTIGRKAYAAVEGRAQAILGEAETLRGELRRLVDEDAAAYAAVSEAYKAPKADPTRAARIDAALLGAAQTPLEVARRAVRLIGLARDIGTIGNTNARSDAKVAEGLARAALAGAVENVRVNVAALSQPLGSARISLWRSWETPVRSAATVRIRGAEPSSPIATVCSKWADRAPSAVTTVHLSGSVRISAPPTLTIGSIAIVIPGTRRGPRLGLP